MKSTPGVLVDAGSSTISTLVELAAALAMLTLKQSPAPSINKPPWVGIDKVGCEQSAADKSRKRNKGKSENRRMDFCTKMQALTPAGHHPAG